MDVTARRAARIELVIDDLVLHGFEPTQRHAIADAVEAELTRLANVHVAALERRPAREVGHVDAGTINLSAPATARGTGVTVARAVFAVLREGVP